MYLLHYLCLHRSHFLAWIRSPLKSCTWSWKVVSFLSHRMGNWVFPRRTLASLSMCLACPTKTIKQKRKTTHKTNKTKQQNKELPEKKKTTKNKYANKQIHKQKPKETKIFYQHTKTNKYTNKNYFSALPNQNIYLSFKILLSIYTLFYSAYRLLCATATFRREYQEGMRQTSCQYC